MTLFFRTRLTKTVLWHLLENDDTLPFIDSTNLSAVHCLIGYHIMAHVGAGGIAMAKATYENGASSRQSRALLTTAPSPDFDDVIGAAEFVALVHLAYYRADDLSLACDLLGLIGRAEDLHIAGLRRYIAPVHVSERSKVYADLYDVRRRISASEPELRRASIRAGIRRLSFPYAVYASVWSEVYGRWKKLSLKKGTFPQRNDPNRISEDGNQQWEEWRNITLFLAATLSSCYDNDPKVADPTGTQPLRAFPRHNLPPRLALDRTLKESVDAFIDQMVEMLASGGDPYQRETALEALCFELHPSVYPELLYKLDAYVISDYFDMIVSVPDPSISLPTTGASRVNSTLRIHPVGTSRSKHSLFR